MTSFNWKKGTKEASKSWTRTRRKIIREKKYYEEEKKMESRWVERKIKDMEGAIKEKMEAEEEGG